VSLFGLNLPEIASKVAHATSQGVAHDVPFIGDGLALEVAALAESE
jgi:hypothetical protein